MTTAISLKERSLLGLKDLSRDEIMSILNRAAYWDSQSEKVVPILNHKFVVNMFLKIVREPASRLKWRKSASALR